MSTVRLLLVGEYKLFRECLAAMLADYDRTQIVGQFDDLATVRPSMERLRPELILFDIGTMEEETLQTLEDFTEEFPACKLIALGLREVEDDILRLIEAGAAAYILKESSLEELKRLIERVLNDEAVCSPQIARSSFTRLAELARRQRRTERLEGLNLTPREVQILQLIAEDLSNKEIAAQLYLSFHTVKNHVHNILEKLKVHDRSEAVEYAYRRRWIRERPRTVSGGSRTTLSYKR